MLCDEDWMAAVRRLAAVLRRAGRREALGDDLRGVLAQPGRAVQAREAALAPAESEPRTEVVLAERVDPRIDQVALIQVGAQGAARFSTR